MPALILLEHVFGSWAMMSFPMPLEAEAGGAVRMSDEFESSVDDDVLVGLGDAAAADQDCRVGRPPFMQRDVDAHRGASPSFSPLASFSAAS